MKSNRKVKGLKFEVRFYRLCSSLGFHAHPVQLVEIASSARDETQ